MSENLTCEIAGARAGNQGAWDRLFRRYQLPLYVYAYELVSNEQDALDVVQESFINAARHIHSLQRDEKFGSWLFGIAHQKCIQVWRKRTRHPTAPEESLNLDAEHVHQQDDSNPRDLLIHAEQEEEFMALINQLPVPQRSVLLLHFIEEFSLEEIAAITEAELGTVKSRMHYAKRALRKLLEGVMQ